MSYVPPQKSRYGDEDFIKEDWSPQQPLTSIGQPPAPQVPFRNPNFGHPNVASTHSPPSPNYEGQRPVNYGTNLIDKPTLTGAEFAKSLTHDDLLFLRDFRRDSFFYRVLPLAAASSGALYYYHRSKNMRQSPWKFVLLGAVCYVVGKWSYRDEFKRRLEANMSTTPFMQALRSMMGVHKIGADGVFASEDLAFQQYKQNLEHQSTSFSPNFDPTSSTVSDNPTEPSSTMSYEQLRARNRGQI